MIEHMIKYYTHYHLRIIYLSIVLSINLPAYLCVYLVLCVCVCVCMWERERERERERFHTFDYRKETTVIFMSKCWIITIIWYLFWWVSLTLWLDLPDFQKGIIIITCPSHDRRHKKRVRLARRTFSFASCHRVAVKIHIVLITRLIS